MCALSLVDRGGIINNQYCSQPPGGDQMFWLHYWGTFTVSIYLDVSAVWVNFCVYCAINEPPHNTSNCFIHCYITFLSIQAELSKNLFRICWKSVAEKLFTWTWDAIENCEDTHNEEVRKYASDVRYESHRLSDWRGDCLSASLSCKHINGEREYNLTTSSELKSPADYFQGTFSRVVCQGAVYS